MRTLSRPTPRPGGKPKKVPIRARTSIASLPSCRGSALSSLGWGILFFLTLAAPYKKYVVVPNAGHFAHIQKGYDVFLREGAS